MILNCCRLPETLKKGVLTLGEMGLLQIGEDGVEVDAVLGDAIVVKKTERKLEITYNTEPHFYMTLALSKGMQEGVHVVEEKVKRLGFMLDCSRNAVATPNTVKQLISHLVLSGYDYLELYTEDTYELPDEPYFGYKRGRYSAQELREIVDFGRIFGFEMVPCIQTLAHLSHLANWKKYYDHMDINDILLAGDERTYDLIRKMIRSCKEMFGTNRINIGGDEAFYLGRGKYTDQNGYRSRHELYLEHMRRVFAICKEEGVYPEFWADGLYDSSNHEEAEQLFDGEQLPIVWWYGRNESQVLDKHLHELKSYAGKAMYAGGFWKWWGFAPFNKYSQKAIDELFEVVERHGIENVLMTAWGDNGNECSPFAVYPSIWYASHKLYPCETDISEIIYWLTGYTKEEWELCDSLNYVMPHIDKMSNADKYILYNDYIIGLLDCNIPDHAGEIYRELIPKFALLAKRQSPYAYLFASYEALCRVLSRKATYSKRLYQAYQEKDDAQIRALMEELKAIQKDMRSFYDIYRSQWLKENKGFGFEIIDIRIGGLVVRADTVLNMLERYLSGELEHIYELEEERLQYWDGRLTGDAVYTPIHGLWATAFTLNSLS